MQLPEPPPPPLASLWDRVLRARALPPDLDVQLLYIAIRDRLTHPEWEVRLHALRVLADLLPLSENALAFPFDQVVDNLGHSSPNVRKAALDALKVFCSYCEEPECAARAILDKCSYQNIRPHSANIEAKSNVITGLILSIPSVFGILKRRHTKLDVYPVFSILGEKLFDLLHKDVALRSLIKLRRVCGPRDYIMYLQQMDTKVQEKFRLLCQVYDEDSRDVFYGTRNTVYRENNHQIRRTNSLSSTISTPLMLSTDSSSEESCNSTSYYRNNFGKIIIETEIKFDSDTAITMTVLEENETEPESDRNLASEDDCESSDQIMLKYSDGDSEDTDVVVKRVRFGGESVKIRTPDSENQVTSDDDKKSSPVEKEDNIKEVTSSVTPVIISKMNELKNEALERESRIGKVKRSGIPLPIIQAKTRIKIQSVPLPGQKNKIKQKSKSLSELYDYFQSQNGALVTQKKQDSKFALTLSEVRSPEKVPSPVEPHREIEVLHNLQRSPVVSPRRHRPRFVQLETNGLITTTTEEPSLLSTRTESPLRTHYEWEDLNIVPDHIVDQLHNEDNWISAVKAADHLHNALLEAENVRKVEPAALSLVQHMWALSEAVPAAKSPAEGAVCALFRGASSDCARGLLPTLVSRLAREPLPAALPHALLQRLSLHHLVGLIFDHSTIEEEDGEKIQSGQLRATLCLARAAGPAAVMSAVRLLLAGTARADAFCQKLRELLNKPVNNTRASQNFRSSFLPVPVKRRARSTPPAAPPAPPRRLRPLPDSAPLPGVKQPKRDLLKPPLSPIPLSDRDSSATTAILEPENQQLADDLSHKTVTLGETTEVDIPAEVFDEIKTPPRSPSIHVEDYSDKVVQMDKEENPRHEKDAEHEIVLKETESKVFGDDAQSMFGSQKSLDDESDKSPMRTQNRTFTPSPVRTEKSALSTPVRIQRTPTASPHRSHNSTPAPTSEPYEEQPSPSERDVRRALSECIVPARHEDWELIVNGLVEMERLALDSGARAPAASWRGAVRAAVAHVPSLRSRVSRAACSAVGALFESRGRALDPELDETACALLERCADVNRFLRADAAAALVRVACGGSCARSAVSLARRGSTHRAGPVRAAATQALARLVQHHGANRILDLSTEPRTVLLRAAGDLLGDANAETREQARKLCEALSEDYRFKPLLKDTMTQARYRGIEKYLDKLRFR